jgi:hypothetical protein
MSLREAWQQFRSDPPGRRFMLRHERLRRAHPSPLARVLRLAGGALLLAAVAILMPLPGPGLLVAALGAGLLASDSVMMARALDRAELRLRQMRRRWRK